MKVYMFQKIKEIYYYHYCECNTEEELFYNYEDAIKYFKEVYNLTIEEIEKNCCETRKTASDLCEIRHYNESQCTIFKEDDFWISLAIYEKTIMSFNK